MERGREGREEMHREMRVEGWPWEWDASSLLTISRERLLSLPFVKQQHRLARRLPRACACGKVLQRRELACNIAPEGQRGMHAFWAAHAGG